MLQNLQAGLCRALMQFVVQIAFAPVRLSPAVAMVMLSPPPVPPLVVRRRLAATTCSRRQKKHALVDCSPCSKHRKAHQGSFDAFHRAMLKGKCAQTLTNTLTKKRGRNIKSLHGPRTVATHTHTQVRGCKPMLHTLWTVPGRICSRSKGMTTLWPGLVST